jgi:hypothetical protein
MPNGFLLGWCKLQESIHLLPDPWEVAYFPFASIPFGKGGFGQFSEKYFENIIQVPLSLIDLN